MRRRCERELGTSFAGFTDQKRTAKLGEPDGSAALLENAGCLRSPGFAQEDGLATGGIACEARSTPG